jgi:hypothetical protein
MEGAASPIDLLRCSWGIKQACCQGLSATPLEPFQTMWERTGGNVKFANVGRLHATIPC